MAQRRSWRTSQSWKSWNKTKGTARRGPFLHDKAGGYLFAFCARIRRFFAGQNGQTVCRVAGIFRQPYQPLPLTGLILRAGVLADAGTSRRGAPGHAAVRSDIPKPHGNALPLLPPHPLPHRLKTAKPACFIRNRRVLPLKSKVRHRPAGPQRHVCGRHSAAISNARGQRPLLRPNRENPS